MVKELLRKIDTVGGILPGGAGQLQATTKEKSPKQKCQENGGFWDEATQTCMMAPPAKTETPKTPEPKNADQVFRDQDSGNISGVTIGGKTYLGLKPQDVEKMTSAQQAKQQGGPATQQFEQQAQMTAQQQAQQLLMQQASEALGTMPAPQNDFETGTGLVGGAVTAGAAVGGGILGAKTGAGIGALLAPFTGGASIPVFAAIGAVVGAIGGAYAKVTLQERQESKEAFKVYNTAKSNQQWILNQVNSGYMPQSKARELWEYERQNIIQAHRHLKHQTSTDLNKFISNAGDELVEVGSYMIRQPYLDAEFELSLAQPDPMRIKVLTNPNEE